MTNTSDETLLDRIHDTNGVNVSDVECHICHELLWKPVECANCHSLYCGECMNKWLQNKPKVCPACKNYAGGKCHPLVIKQLSRLQIKCMHHSRGCSQILNYEALEKHEDGCEYRLGECFGCQEKFLDKDLALHKQTCESIELTCPDCQFVYIRRDASLHTQVKCLCEQLIQRDATIANLRTDFENYRRYQEGMMKKLLHTIDHLKSQFREQQTTNRDPHHRFEELSSIESVASPFSPGQWESNGVTVAGGYGQGSRKNQLNHPTGLYIDENQTIYIADFKNHRVVAWKIGSTTGEVVAGGNGQGILLNQLNHPTDVIVDRQTDSLLICDRDNRRVMRWPRLPLSSRQPEILISNIACGRLALDNQNSLYVSDREKDEVRRYDKPDDKIGTVVAGGYGKGANLNQLDRPVYIFVDAQFTLYVSDHDNNRVMKWMRGAKEGIVVAGGNGIGADLKQLSGPTGVRVDEYGHVYVAEWGNHRVMCWEKGAKKGRVIVGGNGQNMEANQLSNPHGLFFDSYGHLYVSEFGNHRVQRFSLIFT